MATTQTRDAPIDLAALRAVFDGAVLEPGDAGPDRVRAAYGPANHDRLVALKRAYDPTDFLRLNHNVSP
jgi:hypothetical protein